LRDRDDPERDDPVRDDPERDDPEREAGARLVVFLAGLRVLVRVLEPLREAPGRAAVLDLVLLPVDRGGEPAPELVLAFARDRGGEGTRVAMAREPTPSPHQPQQSRAGT
jgi:hypothetical protein